MKNKCFWVCSGLVLLLVISNIWWMFTVFDAGITLTYTNEALKTNRSAVDQLLEVLKAQSDEGVSKSEIIQVAKEASGGSEPFEKEGFVWIGNIGLRFSIDGKLIEAKRAWSYVGT